LVIEFTDVFAVAVDVDHRHYLLPIDSPVPVQVPIRRLLSKKICPIQE
jgi:hypothetical protein